MMIIVAVSQKSGLFQWLAYCCYRLCRGKVLLLASALMVLTALTSAFLDNVTTMLLIIPVSLEIASVLKINPISLLIPEVFASNIGGAATLIGDPPNIMIGSYAGLSFLDFILNLTWPCLAALAVGVAYFLYRFRKDYRLADSAVPQRLESGGRAVITDPRLLVLSLFFLGVTVLLFLLHGVLEMMPSVAALIGATGLLVTSKADIVELLEKKVEWPTLIFFTALFVVVAAAQESGLIHFLADAVKDFSGDSRLRAVLLVLWVSAIASALIDNIPFVATMLPVVGYLASVLPGAQDGVLWWALALGACLGGNGSMIGASANMVTAGMAEKAGHPISFAAMRGSALRPCC